MNKTKLLIRMLIERCYYLKTDGKVCISQMLGIKGKISKIKLKFPLCLFKHLAKKRYGVWSY
jgi:hypothetical protein